MTIAQPKHGRGRPKGARNKNPNRADEKALEQIADKLLGPLADLAGESPTTTLTEASREVTGQDTHHANAKRLRRKWNKEGFVEARVDEFSKERQHKRQSDAEWRYLNLHFDRDPKAPWLRRRKPKSC